MIMEEQPPAPVLTLDDAYNAIYDFWKASFPSPAHLISFYDPDVRDGKDNLYGWQAKIHTETLSKDYTSDKPLELALQAVNGSGKDRFVLAPFEAWFMCLNKHGTIIVTSSSGQQLTTQTEKYIRLLCEKINKYHQLELFDVKQRHIKCHVTQSDMFLFATDEAGKAEGYHPIVSGGKLAIIINEAKTVKEEIFEALTRCTGFTHWLEVSSPGKPDGHFYKMCKSERPSVKYYRVKSDDCPHHGSAYKERIKELYGENHNLYKSMVDCDFSSDEEQVVLTYEKFERCVKYPPEYYHGGRAGGLDLSGGGDEQSLAIRVGNKLIKILTWKIKDATILVDKLIKAFEDNHLKGCPIYADGGGLGKPIIDMLHKEGWTNVRAIYNQSNPNDELAYANLGTEMWFRLATLIENQSIIISHPEFQDDRFKAQICSRYYKFTANNTAQLESKAQARAKGHPSPDRADSVALCFMHFKSQVQQHESEERIKKLEQGEVANNCRIPTLRGMITADVIGGSNQRLMSHLGMNPARTLKNNPHLRDDLRLEIKQALAAIKNN